MKYLTRIEKDSMNMFIIMEYEKYMDMFMGILETIPNDCYDIQFYIVNIIKNVIDHKNIKSYFYEKKAYTYFMKKINFYRHEANYQKNCFYILSRIFDDKKKSYNSDQIDEYLNLLLGMICEKRNDDLCYYMDVLNYLLKNDNIREKFASQHINILENSMNSNLEKNILLINFCFVLRFQLMRKCQEKLVKI